MIQPQFPIYIPSKSRWASRLTMLAFDRWQIDYRVIVEEQQLADYAAVIPTSRLLILDPKFQDEFETCDEYGRTKSLGSGPARNMAWADSIARGYDWHWIIDDNISWFAWRRDNHEIPAADAAPLVAMEDFVLRYTNVAMAGPNYEMFVPCRTAAPPFVTGTRVYSCNLIRNSLPFRWRCRYNEDVDLSLRILKAGWNTVLFNAFLQQKSPTQTMAGGNTEAFYADEGTLAKSQMLVSLHPDVTRLAWRYGRPHHYVDYSAWRGRALIPDPAAPPPRTWNTSVQARSYRLARPDLIDEGASLRE